MKAKPPKMTKLEKAKQNSGSRFIRVIPAPRYAEYLASEESWHLYNERGYRIK